MLLKSESRKKIIDNFHKNVLGKYPDKSKLKSSHEGNLGHWLEFNLGGKIDSDGDADLNGFECKIESKKMSWGDWGAPYRIFCDKSYKTFNTKTAYENMWKLIEVLGVLRDTPEKGIFYSMSGKDVPAHVNELTNIGLSLKESGGDISYVYNFSADQRETKNKTVPDELQKDDLLIFKWYGTDKSFNTFKKNIINNNLPIDVKWDGSNRSVSIEERIRRKFGIYGIVVGLKDESRGFYGLKFLKSISFEDWLNFFRNKDVIYDTALTTRNKRPYNQWRSSAKFMKTLEEDIYIP